MLNNKLNQLALPFFLLGFCLQVNAGVTSSQVKHITYQVPLNKSLLINLDKKVGKISKGNPSIADILLFPPNQIFLRGKSLGTTNAIIWDKNNRVSMVLDVEITHNLESLKQKLYELLPNERIQVRSAQNNIIISGEVSNLVKMDAAMKLAQGYAIRKKQGGGGQQQQGKTKSTGVINMMHVGGGQQVMLEVKVAEIERKLSRELNIEAGAQSTLFEDGSFIWNAATAAGGIFSGAYVAGNTLFSWSLDFSKKTGLATILAEPNLTTLSGKKASFLSGGEFPYSSDCDLGNCEVDFKKFGVGVEFIPVVLDSNRINLTTTVSVSSLSNDANEVVSTFSDQSSEAIEDTDTPLNLSDTPSLKLREAQTTIELADGQTMSIAGLLNKDSQISQEHTPGFADLPLIGTLFRDRESRDDKKELIILVTPHLARPIAPDQIRLPTDSYVEPDDYDFYVLGRMESRKINPPNPDSGGINGQFGHQINDGSL